MSVAIPPEVEAEAREMQMALGQAISAWARVEGNLCHLFSIAVGGSNPAPATEAFCAVLSFKVQLAMTNRAMKSAYAQRPDVLIRWKELCRRIRKRTDERNELAHGEILRTLTDKWSVDFAPFHHVGAGKSLDQYDRRKVTDIEAYRASFSALAQDLGELHFALLTRETLPRLPP